jgi:hypothetical protein
MALHRGHAKPLPFGRSDTPHARDSNALLTTRQLAMGSASEKKSTLTPKNHRANLSNPTAALPRRRWLRDRSCSRLLLGSAPCPSVHKSVIPRSANGHERRFRDVRITSAYAPRAATKRTWKHFAFVPLPDSHRSKEHLYSVRR